MTKDRVIGIVSVILGVLVAMATMQLPESTMAGDIGPKAFPFISAGILIICGVGLAITGKKKSEAYYTPQQTLRLAAVFGVVLGYVVLMTVAGYLIATLLATFVLCCMFGKGKGIPVWKYAVFTLVLTFVLYFVFTRLFSIMLPAGMLF